MHLTLRRLSWIDYLVAEESFVIQSYPVDRFVQVMIKSFLVSLVIVRDLMLAVGIAQELAARFVFVVMTDWQGFAAY